MSNKAHTAPQLGSARKLDTLFKPRSVAIVGASDNNNMSLCAWRNIQRHGFPGPIHLVNANQDLVHGARAVRSLRAIGEPVDVILSLVGAARMSSIMEEAAECGSRNLVIVSGGFAEEGEKGAALQRQLMELSSKNGQIVLGPNTIGFLNLHAKAVLYGSPVEPPSYPDHAIQAGPVGAIVQSGVIAHTLIRGMLARRLGLSTVAALGNELNVRLHDVIEHLVQDEDTRVIAMFVETVRDHKAFRLACFRAQAAGKPIVAMRAGRSAVGAATAVSHTGALAGDDAVNDAAFRQLGIISVDSMEELMVTCAYLANHRVPKGRKAAFVSVSGGFCEMFADRAEGVGIELPKLTAKTQAALRDILPSSAMVMNPIDTTGVAQTDNTLIPKVLEIVSRDPNVEVLFVAHNQWHCAPADENFLLERYRPLGEAIRRSPIPVHTVSDTLSATSDFELKFEKELGIPRELGGIWFGLKAFAQAVQWRSSLEAPSDDEAPEPVSAPFSPMERRPLAEFDVLRLLSESGIPVVPWRLAKDKEAAIAAAEQLGYPVALKVSSAQIAHKSAVGGVALNLRDEAALSQAWDSVMSAANQVTGAVIDGALIMPMRSSGLEMIVGVKRDATWGHVLIIGLGGVWTELLRDTVVCTLPATSADIRKALQRLRGARLLNGGHGLKVVDMDKLVGVIQQVARLGQSIGDAVDAIEINPFKVDGSSMEALDGLVVWREEVPRRPEV